MAVNCCCCPAAIEGLAGVTAIDTSIGAVTVSVGRAADGTRGGLNGGAAGGERSGQATGG